MATCSMSKIAHGRALWWRPRLLAVGLAATVSAANARGVATPQPAAEDLAREDLEFAHFPSATLDRMPCRDKLSLLSAAQQAPLRGPRLSREEHKLQSAKADEAHIIQAVMAYRNECGLRAESSILKAMAANRQDVAEVLRVVQAPTLEQRAAKGLQTEDLAAIERSGPRPSRAAVPVTQAAPVCAYGPSPEFAAFSGQLYRREAINLDPAAVGMAVNVLRYWAAQHMGDAALCQGPPTGPWTLGQYFYWPRIVTAWQATERRPVTGSLSADDLTFVRGRLVEIRTLMQAQGEIDAARRRLDEEKAAKERVAEAAREAEYRDRERRQRGIQPSDTR